MIMHLCDKAAHWSCSITKKKENSPKFPNWKISLFTEWMLMVAKKQTNKYQDLHINFKNHTGHRDSSVGKCACYQTCDLSLSPKTHSLESQNWLPHTRLTLLQINECNKNVKNEESLSEEKVTQWQHKQYNNIYVRIKALFRNIKYLAIVLKYMW